MAAARILQRIIDNISDILLFHGIPDIDTTKAATFMDRIKQCIPALAWTPEQAFTGFREVKLTIGLGTPCALTKP